MDKRVIILENDVKYHSKLINEMRKKLTDQEDKSNRYMLHLTHNSKFQIRDQRFTRKEKNFLRMEVMNQNGETEK